MSYGWIIHNLFKNTTLTAEDLIASDDYALPNQKHGDKMAMVNYKISWHLPETTDENQNKP